MEGFAVSKSRFSQLRFDVTEMVRLHPQQPGIGTLLELDLNPDVEIRDEGKHLKIQGYLRLNGAYLGDPEADEVEVINSQSEVREDLAYVIPVEITIPADRAELDNISAEVETFDYSVVSPFELQVEAILVIDGLLPEEQIENKATQRVLTHETTSQPSFSAKPVASENVTPSNEAEKGIEQQSEFREYLGTPAILDEENKTSVKDEIRPELHFTAGREDEAAVQVAVKEPSSVEYLHNLWNRKRAVEEVTTDQNQFAQDQFAMEKEVENNTESSVMVHSSEGTLEKSEWIHWLVREKNESFAPMRMVISQKDESIDTLADKYGVSVGNLMSFNQLEDDNLVEGQIIYVPRQLQRSS